MPGYRASMLRAHFRVRQKALTTPDAFALGPSTATNSGEGDGIIFETPMVAKYTVVKAKRLVRVETYL
jgi:hypothetical protein